MTKINALAEPVENSRDLSLLYWVGNTSSSFHCNSPKLWFKSLWWEQQFEGWCQNDQANFSKISFCLLLPSRF